MTDELKEALAALATARVWAAKSKSELDAAKKAFEDANSTRILLAKNDANAVEYWDTKARTLALAVYTESKDKNPAPGISIGLGKKIALTYDADRALAWARETNMALALDVKAFEKIAEAANLAFVSKAEIETQRIAIASDLTKFYPITETVVEEPEPLFTPGYPQEETDELDT